MCNRLAIIFADCEHSINPQKPNCLALLAGSSILSLTFAACTSINITNFKVICDADTSKELPSYAESIDSSITAQQMCDIIKNTIVQENIAEIVIMSTDMPIINKRFLCDVSALHSGMGYPITGIIGDEPIAYYINSETLVKIFSLYEDSGDDIFVMIAKYYTDCKYKGNYNFDEVDPFEPLKTTEALYHANYILRWYILDFHSKNGVIFETLDGITISPLAKIGKGTTILTGSRIIGESVIAEGCIIGPHSTVSNSSIASNVILNQSQCYDSTIESNVKIGPFCHIRPNSVIKDGAKLGDFVEVKNSVIGEKTSVSHLTYIGDSDVGSYVNFGCGVVTVNYNGVTKARCTIDDGAFIGCNTNLVAPVHIGKGAYTAAGSTVTQDVLGGDLCIARARQVNKPSYGERLLKK